MDKFNSFSDGKHGAAIAIRITPRASKNEVVEILNDRTVKIRLVASPEGNEMNTMLINFLSKIIGVPRSNLSIVAGDSGRDKLVSIEEVDLDFVQQKILENLA